LDACSDVWSRIRTQISITALFFVSRSSCFGLDSCALVQIDVQYVLELMVAGESSSGMGCLVWVAWLLPLLALLLGAGTIHE
jgi:hypothetical protein